MLRIGAARVAISTEGNNAISTKTKRIENDIEVIMKRLKEDKIGNRHLLGSLARVQPIIDKLEAKKKDRELKSKD